MAAIPTQIRQPDGFTTAAATATAEAASTNVSFAKTPTPAISMANCSRFASQARPSSALARKTAGSGVNGSKIANEKPKDVCASTVARRGADGRAEARAVSRASTKPAPALASTANKRQRTTGANGKGSMSKGTT